MSSGLNELSKEMRKEFSELWVDIRDTKLPQIIFHMRGTYQARIGQSRNPDYDFHKDGSPRKRSGLTKMRLCSVIKEKSTNNNPLHQRQYMLSGHCGVGDYFSKRTINSLVNHGLIELENDGKEIDGVVSFRLTERGVLFAEYAWPRYRKPKVTHVTLMSHATQ